jgi:hypothetical protein
VSDVSDAEYGTIDEFVFCLAPGPEGKVWVWRDAEWRPFLIPATEVRELTGYAELSRDEVVRRGIPPDPPA